MRHRADGRLVACEVVWAEVTAGFPAAPEADEALGRLQVAFSASGCPQPPEPRERDGGSTANSEEDAYEWSRTS